MNKQKKVYLTTAIDYVNGRPHIGHILEKIQADVYARFYRKLGFDVWFLTGTDEHGTKIERAAQEAGEKPQHFVDEMSSYFKGMKSAFDLSWDDFIRTSDRNHHWPGAQLLWKKIYEKGDLYKKQYRGFYCVGCEAFVTPKDLADGLCPVHKRKPELVEEENWFFRLSKYANDIKRAISKERISILPRSRKNEILGLLDKGLEDVSFSRPKNSLRWGIPVPNDPGHIMYVWCDALTNYISAIGYGRDEDFFYKWWPADIHFIGKDILRFHAAIWPAMLLSAGLELPHSIFVHGFITIEGQKMSKSIGNVIDPFLLVEEFGVDELRYYLLREVPSDGDGDFSRKKFIARYNGELANGLGNLVARSAKLGEEFNELGNVGDEVDALVKGNILAITEKVQENFDGFRLNEALAHIWELISLADGYLSEKKPWTIRNLQRRKKIVISALWIVWSIADLIEPFLPTASRQIKEQIRYTDGRFVVRKGKPLFPRLR